jgi:pyruvate,water dikinase
LISDIGTIGIFPQVMAANGLRQSQDGLEVYAMCELPSNVVSADEFLKVFDGYSIGSNDLTQLVLGLDRDSGTVAHLFDERNAAVRQMIARAIDAAHGAGKPIGICGQAPSDYPDFAAWLVRQGINSISLNPDTAVKTAFVIAKEEAAQAQATAYGSAFSDGFWSTPPRWNGGGRRSIMRSPASQLPR